MNELTLKQKDAIREGLQAYCERYPSQNRAAGSLKGVSAGTVSIILNGKYENISEEMFRNIAAQVSSGSTSGWQIVETKVYKEINVAMSDAQEWRNVTWVVGDAGCGKTTTAQMYARSHGEVFYILCSEDMSKAEFIREIARTIGLKTDRLPIRELWDAIIGALIQMESPLMVFDEADKLTDNVFHYFISFYNRLEDKCGIIFLSTDYIKRRMDLGLRHNKQGYNEIHSRIGRKFYELDAASAHDIHAICVANGVSSKAKISEVIKDAESYDFDLRRVKKMIHKVKRLSENEA
jgi:DNA transposition AAA+ family ATPase